MRIAVLWTGMTGYLNACLRALSNFDGVELFVCYEQPEAVAPFDASEFDWIPDVLKWRGLPDKDLLLKKLEAFSPDVILGAAYHVAPYRVVARHFAKRALRVYCTDNQWRGTFKQWIGVATSPWFARALYDGVFVAGERQALWAHRMGFHDDQIWHGLYSCDHTRFSEVHNTRAQREPPRSFLSVSRLSAEKGIDILVRAYTSYREHGGRWPLVIAGTGPLASLAEGREGISLKGFVQPAALPELFAAAGALVVSSTYEPWALVIHEAAAAGVPVICTRECGASVHLVRDGYSGYLVETGNAGSLSSAMTRLSGLPDDRRAAMGEASYSLSLQFTPQRWAEYVYEKSVELAAERLPTLFAAVRNYE